jgi:GR25 family glycosyltransferase involved in LPS biosynthesis
MIENDIDYGIIFENDIFISKNFEKAIHKAISEIEERKIKDIFLSLEDSYFRFVPGSQRIKGQTVYKTDGSNTRCAGAYLVDLQCAKTLINEVNLNKCDCVIDHFHTYCAKIGLIDVYWLHPTIASQGSRNGKLKSLFRERKLWYPKIFRRISYIVQRLYKRFLWRMR